MTLGPAPDILFPELFEAVQSSRVLDDSKAFVDAIPRGSPADILRAYLGERSKEDFNLAEFVNSNFELPAAAPPPRERAIAAPVGERIETLWNTLTREADRAIAHSSLIPLPNRYVVPGGRFREVYYWDSYFTMLGLADSGHTQLVRDMVDNFAYLIDEIGFVPNGNRTYYCTRSQPPYFSLMIELLATIDADDSVYVRYLPQLEREYRFWMDGVDELSPELPAYRHVVRGPRGPLNRYWDDLATPRQESYAEDLDLAATAGREPEALYRDLRAGAESGWDYSSRWLANPMSLSSIRTTSVVPVDLNALLCHLEQTLAHAYRLAGDAQQSADCESRAELRRDALRSIFFDSAEGMFVDLELPGLQPTGILSIAAVYPLFLGLATPAQAHCVAEVLQRDFLKPGGWVTSNHAGGQQWDSPNGWAPMQWLTYEGLRRYGYEAAAEEGARRWVNGNLAVYQGCGRLLEKYNVESVGVAGAGGEYPVQDGFGWTNAVLLRLMP
ncbi:MAG: alpha,alpha-trehalase TreF [Pseudomonadota bacterium]